MRGSQLHISKSLRKDKVAKTIEASKWLAESEVILVFVKCNNMRPMMDALVVTNARIVGVMGKELKNSQLFTDLATVEYDPKGKVEVTGVGDSVTFKAVASDDMPVVQHFIEEGRQQGAPAELVRTLEASGANLAAQSAREGPLGHLSRKSQRKLISALAPDENVVLAMDGEHGAILATDRRIIIGKWGMTTGALMSSQVNSWDLLNVTGIEVRKGMSTKSIVVQTAGTVPVTKFGRFDDGAGSVWESPHALFVSSSTTATTADGADLDIDRAAIRLRDMVSEAQDGRLVQAIPVPSAQPSVADQIRQLAQLRDEGLITDEEFDAKKKSLLGL